MKPQKSRLAKSWVLFYSSRIWKVYPFNLIYYLFCPCNLA